MTGLLQIDMNEATRLTRLGRLTEAMAILREENRIVANDVAGEEPSGILDMSPPATPGGAWTPPSAAAPETSPTRSTAAAAPDFAALFGRSGRTDPGAILQRGARSSQATMASGARFDQATYSIGSASRTYKLYIPSGYDGQPIPLVVMLHGCTQSPDDFAAGTRMNDLAEEQGFLVAYPAQPQSANASKCWNWFNTGDQKRDKGEPALIAGITRQIIADFAIDRDRVYIAGLSAGGAAAAIMGSTYPDLYAAIGVHSGLACGAARDMPSAFGAMSQGAAPPLRSTKSRTVIPTIVFHGDKDGTVNKINGDHVIAQSRNGAHLNTSVTRGASAAGVGFTRAVQADMNTPMLEQWVIHGAGHAWSGGSAAGSYTDPKGPDASREMIRFFLQHRLATRT